jgi:4-amino-4-deoxy-L-arabinose transferase-like glycosyltransferase
MAFVLTARERRLLALFVIAVILVRLATLGAYPLMDSTESRYAEIARKMLETGDWLTPQFDYGVPFWGKPPLSTWLSAAAMGVLGVGEFAARLPSLLLALACGIPVALHATPRGGPDQRLWTLALFASTVLVFIAAGAVMTDTALALGTTMSMTGFWIAVRGPDRQRAAAAISFFAGLAIGLLAKGPVAAVLSFLPIGSWVLFTGRWRDAWTRLPWVGGLLLTAALVVPWYWAAERATPGFVDYFLVGEHWKRFVEPGWKGDLYGAAHARPRGMIWLYWIAAALPWSPVALAWLGRGLMQKRVNLHALVADPWRLYLLLWAIAPMIFFTVSGNILATYVLPGLPAFALLLGDLWRPRPQDERTLRSPVRALLAVGTLIPVLFVVGIVAGRDRFERALSHQELVLTWSSRRANNGERLIYLGRPPPSADFYSRGKAMRVPDIATLALLLAEPAADFIAIRTGDLARLPDAIRSQLVPLGEFGDYQLLHESPR